MTRRYTFRLGIESGFHCRYPFHRQNSPALCTMVLLVIRVYRRLVGFCHSEKVKMCSSHSLRHQPLLSGGGGLQFLCWLGLVSPLCTAAFDTLERAEHWTALHVAQTILPLLGTNGSPDLAASSTSSETAQPLEPVYARSRSRDTYCMQIHSAKSSQVDGEVHSQLPVIDSAESFI